MTSTWVGACGLISRNASTRSVSPTRVAGISPATMAQNKHSVTPRSYSYCEVSQVSRPSPVWPGGAWGLGGPGDAEEGLTGPVGRQNLTSPPIRSHSGRIAVLLSNHVAMRCYGADPCKCCRNLALNGYS